MIFACLLQILMSALCLVHVNKNVLTLMGPTSAHVQKVLYLKVTTRLVKVKITLA